MSASSASDTDAEDAAPADADDGIVAPVNAPLIDSDDILSFSSRTILCAVFAPMPFARVNALLSPDATRKANCSGVTSERMDIAAFGPTPETEISRRKQLLSLIRQLRQEI